MAVRELVVVGADLVGLVTAWHTSRAGLDTVVVDGTDPPGGEAVVRLPIGLCPELARDLHELVPGALTLRRPRDRVLVRGRWLEVPVARRQAAWRAAVPGFVEKLWGMPPAALDPDAVDGALEAAGLGARGGLPVSIRRSSPTAWWSLDGGAPRLEAALLAQIGQAGGDVRRRCTVDGIRWGDEGLQVHTDDGGTLTARSVICARPLREVIELLRDVPYEVRNAVAATRWRGIVQVLFPAPPRWCSTGAVHWIADGATPLLRLTEVVPPEAGAPVWLSAELAATRDDPIWSAADDELIQLASDHLGHCRLPTPASRSARVRRWPDVLPVPRSGLEHHLGLVGRWLGGVPGFAVLTRPALLPEHQLDHSLGTGRLAAAWAARQLAASSATACAASQTST